MAPLNTARACTRLPALLLALVAAAAMVGSAGGQPETVSEARTGMVEQALAALQAATEKLEFDEDKFSKLKQTVASDERAVQRDLRAVNHPEAAGLSSAEAVVRKGQLDTQKLQSDRLHIPALEAIVEEDKQELDRAELAYEIALGRRAPPGSADAAAAGAAGGGGRERGGRSSAPSPHGGQAGDEAGSAHFDSSPWYSSRHWASCPPCSNGTPQEIADWLETTMEGMEWIQSHPGLVWLVSDRGQRWLATPQGAEWPFTQAGESFLSSEWGRIFLASQAGKDWLRSPPGLRWLREHQPWAASSLRLRNAALASLVAVCVAGLLSAHLIPVKSLPADAPRPSVTHAGPFTEM